MRSFLSLCQQSDFPTPRGQSSELRGSSLLPTIYELRLVSLKTQQAALERFVPSVQRTHCLQSELTLG